MPDLTTLFNRFLQALYAGSASMPVGSGTATATVNGTLTVNTTQAGTPASTAETDLWTYSLPANTLNANGKGVRITAFGSFAANANAKTVRVRFNGTQVAGGGDTSSGSAWQMSVDVVRTGASAQVSVGLTTIGSTILGHSLQTPAGDTTGAITLQVTGQNGVASASDIVFRGVIVESLN